MFLTWNSISFCAFFLVFVDGCQGHERGIDFHLDDQTVRTWPGSNLTVLCDATSYRNETHLAVLWQDVTGRTIGSRVGRVFAVQYNRGFMNRLVLLQVNDDTAGTYVCTVMRNEQVLEHKHITVYLLGRRIAWDPVYPENTDHRRGDLPIETGLDYRPVRSAERGSRSAERGSTGRLAKSATSFLPDGLRNFLPWSRVDRLGKLSDRRNYKPGRARVLPHPNLVIDNHKQIDTRNIQQEPTIANKMKTGDLELALKKRLKDKEIPMSGVMIISGEMNSVKHKNSLLNENLSLGGLYSGDKSEQEINKRVLTLFSRNKRQIAADSTQAIKENSVASDLTTSNSVSVGSGEEEIYTSDTQEEQISHETLSTNTSSREVSVTTTIGKVSLKTKKIKSNSDISTTPLVQSTAAQEKPDISITPLVQSTAAQEEFMEDQDDTPVTSTCPQTSKFGQYGIMALSVALAVVVLLLYAICMIVFMPKILARRRLKTESGITGNATYKKTDPDKSELATIQIIDVGGAAETGKDSLQNKADETNQQLIDEKENNEMTASIPGKEGTTIFSSFLLRQGSQKKDEENKKLASNDKKGEPIKFPEAAPETPRQSPGTDTQMEPSPTPELNLTHQNLPQLNVSQEPQNKLQPPGDFSSSLVLGLSLTESIQLDDQNQLVQTADNSTGNTLATSTGENTLKHTSTPGSDDLDLLPPPPPIQDSNNVTIQ